MGTLETILRQLTRHRSRIFEQYKLKTMAIFGSTSRGDATPESDVDILVEFQKPIGIAFVDLADELESILGKKVDLVSRVAVKPKYYRHIEPDLVYV